MKKKNSPKLRLDKETLRALDQKDALAGVAGGCGGSALGCNTLDLFCSDSICVNLCP